MQQSTAFCRHAQKRISLTFLSLTSHVRGRKRKKKDIDKEDIVMVVDGHFFFWFQAERLTRQWVNFTTAYVTFENTSSSLPQRIQRPYPFLLSLWPIYPAALSGLWRPHDDVIGPLTSPARCLTWPLREQPRFYLPSLLSSPLQRRHPTRVSQSCLFPKLNGRVLSHSCGYSFGQRAWPTFRNICRIVRRRISQDNTVDSRSPSGSHRRHSSFIIIVPSLSSNKIPPLLPSLSRHLSRNFLAVDNDETDQSTRNSDDRSFKIISRLVRE